MQTRFSRSNSVTLPPNRCGLLADVRVVRLLEIASASREGGQHRGGYVRFEYGIGDPPAGANVDEVDRGAVVIVKERAIDAAEPVQPVSVAGPYERAVADGGEPGDPTIQAFVGPGVSEADESHRQRAIDGRLQFDVVTAGPHRSAVHIGHPRYSAREMATFKRYLMFQAMMFVFGIVGPIFLIMYFATQPDHTVRWAYWWGLFITAGDVLIALWLTATTAENNTPADVSIAMALQKRMHRGEDDG